MSQSPRTWLITGCSTGFGRALAQRLIARGDRVVATARRPQSLEDLVAGHDNAKALALDVTVPAQIEAAVCAAMEMFGGIDVLVNNAGYGYLAAVEEGEDQAVRAMFETNLFGLIGMTKAVLPGMRARGRGHIVNISSVGGLVGNPGSGYYAGTKFAVEGVSEALSREVAPLGLKVTLVEPGPFRTDWAGRSLQLPERFIDAYAPTVGARRKQLTELSGHQPGDPVRAADAIIAVVDSPTPPLHLVLGAPGLKMVRDKLAALEQDIATWEAVTLGADFPSQ
jgi:NAD(P)-dependent dehydrogenase (short-subunit alcohol dehydrogenase family)